MAIQHSAITATADCHEPKGLPALNGGASDVGKVYVSNGAGSGTWKWQPQALTLDITSLDTVTDYYLVMPYAGTIDKVYTVIDAAVATADKTLTLSIGGVAVTGGVVTITSAASAAGDIDSCTPSAANTVTAGQALKIAATGGSTGAARCHVTIIYTRTA